MIDLFPNSTFFYEIVLFLILIMILRFLLFKPILEIVEKRKGIIEGDLKRAEEVQKKAEESLEKYNTTVASVRREMTEAFALAQREATARQREVIGEAESQSIEMMAGSRDEIQAETLKAKAALHEESRELALKIAEKVAGRPVSA